MDNENGVDGASQMEINISNTNSQSQIVLNDLRLLELLHKYPFLFSKAVRHQSDEDYDEWGWEEIAKAFNMSYEGLGLSAPFSVDELQWRWEVLRPICPALAKAYGQIPDPLYNVIVKINQLLTLNPPAKLKQKLNPTQKLMLDQLPFVKQLTEAQKRSLEVDILDAILGAEQARCKELSKKQENIVQNDYEEFLKAIRVKELPAHVASRATSVSSNGACTTTPHIVNNLESKLVISSVHSALDTPAPEITLTNSSPVSIKVEPPDQLEVVLEPKYTPPADELQVRYVPLKSAQYFVKRLKVRVKRLDLDEYLPLSKIRKLSLESG